MKQVMRRGATVAILAAVLMVASFAGVAIAEEEGEGSFWDKTKVTGSIDVNYNYNFNRPGNAGAGALNQYRVFDMNTNSFNLGLVDLAIENSPTDWVTFRTDLDFGQDVALFHSPGLAGAEADGGAGVDNFDLQQAYVVLKANTIGNGLSFKIGKFVTMHGAEVIEAAANNNVSRSFLFNYAIPFTHTGILASYPFADWITFDLGVVNGWNNVLDNNAGKSFHAMFTIKPIDKLTWYLGGTFGPETAGNDGDWRFLLDTTLSYAATDTLTLALNYDLGRDRGGFPAGGGFADWQGFAAYAHWVPFDFFGLTLRGEYFRDDVGFAGPTNVAAPGVGSTRLYEGTGTAHFYLADGVDLRFEFRHDQGNNASFARGGGAPRKFQDTIASQLVYAF